MKTILFFYQNLRPNNEECYSVICKNKDIHNIIEWQKNIHKTYIEYGWRIGELEIRIVDNFTNATF